LSSLIVQKTPAGLGTVPCKSCGKWTTIFPCLQVTPENLVPPGGIVYYTPMPDSYTTIDQIRLDEANARRRTPEGAKAIHASLAEFGAARSIVLDGDNVIRAGNGTVEEARKAGISKVRVIDTDGDEIIAVRRRQWSPEQAVAYGIADNKTTDLSTFDFDQLRESMSGLSERLQAATGFNQQDVESLFSKFHADESDMPELKEGDRPGFQQMTFILSDPQVANVQSAIQAAKKAGPFVDSENQNSNGNALARIAESYLGTS
jgi:hypothetical protein